MRNRATYVCDSLVNELYRQSNVGYPSTFAGSGYPVPHHRWVHLYLNGLYWGLYEAVEPHDEEFAVDYYGGEKEDYDIISPTEVTAGEYTAWQLLLQTAQQLQNDAVANPARTTNTSTQWATINDLVDLDNLIDYLLPNLYLANQDWPYHNWQAMRNRTAGGKFFFTPWDAEFCMKTGGPAQYPNMCAPFRNMAASGGLIALVHNLSASIPFRQKLWQRSELWLNKWTVGTPSPLLSLFNTKVAEIQPFLPLDIGRWASSLYQSPVYKMDTYLGANSGPNYARTFLSARTAAYRHDLWDFIQVGFNWQPTKANPTPPPTPTPPPAQPPPGSPPPPILPPAAGPNPNPNPPPLPLVDDDDPPSPKPPADKPPAQPIPEASPCVDHPDHIPAADDQDIPETPTGTGKKPLSAPFLR